MTKYRTLPLIIIFVFELLTLYCEQLSCDVIADQLQSRECHLNWNKQLPGDTQNVLAVSQHRGIVFVTQGASVFAVHTTNGSIVWRSDFFSENVVQDITAAQKIEHVDLLPPTIAHGLIFVAYSYGAASRLVALDAATGKQRWEHSEDPARSRGKFDLNGEILSPPYVWRDRIIFRTGRGLTAIRIIDGVQLWKVPMDSSIEVPLAQNAMPTGTDVVYFNSDFGIAYAFDPLSGRNIWKAGTAGLKDESILNVRKIHITFTNCPPILVQGKLIIADGLGDIYALNAKSGAIQWQTKPASYIFHFATFGGAIYAATNQGLLQLDLNSGQTIRQYEPTEKILRCEIAKDQAILTKFPTGWEIFDLHHWKPVASENNYAPYLNVATSDNMFFLAGKHIGQTKNGETELRAYSIASY